MHEIVWIDSSWFLKWICSISLFFRCEAKLPESAPKSFHLQTCLVAARWEKPFLPKQILQKYHCLQLGPLERNPDWHKLWNSATERPQSPRSNHPKFWRCPSFIPQTVWVLRADCEVCGCNVKCEKTNGQDMVTQRNVGKVLTGGRR